MNEYQFKLQGSFWLDVHANTKDEAVRLLNDSLHLLDEPLPGPGPIQRVLVDARDPVTLDNIESSYNLRELKL